MFGDLSMLLGYPDFLKLELSENSSSCKTVDVLTNNGTIFCIQGSKMGYGIIV